MTRTREWLKTLPDSRYQKNKVDAPVGLSPRPFVTSPLVLRSMFQLSVSPALFFRVKAKTALPCLIAFFRSVSSEVRALLITLKASEAGNAAASLVSKVWLAWSPERVVTVLERHRETVRGVYWKGGN